METMNNHIFEAKRETLAPDELRKAMKEMIRVREQEGSVIAQLGDPSYVARQLYEMSQRGLVVKFYKGNVFVGLMAYDVGQLWWLEQPLLIEQLVLSCDKEGHGVQREAINALDALARYVYPFVAGIASGNLFMERPQIVMNAYKKAGYTQTAPTSIKVIDRGGECNGEGR